MIKVIIERRCQAGKEKELRDLLVELRSLGMRQRGYVTGETLREVGNSSVFMVISSWVNLETWKAWQTSRQRLIVEEMIDSLLVESRQVRIFTITEDM